MRLRTAFVLAAVCVVLTWTISAFGADVTVDCSKKKETINGALVGLSKQGPNTIHVSGACNEYVQIQGYDNLTLLANAGASINDPTPSVADDTNGIDIFDSRFVTVEGFTINGNFNGITCGVNSSCFLTNNVIQGASDWGVLVGRGSSAEIRENTIQNNGGGVEAINTGHAMLIGGSVLNNTDAGVYSSANALVRFFNTGTCGTPPQPACRVLVQGNGLDGEFGIVADTNATIVFTRDSATVTGNGVDGGGGIRADWSSVVRIGQFNAITGNGFGGAGGGPGIHVGGSSFVFIAPNATVSGNSGTSQVVCGGQFSNVEGQASLTCHTP